MKGRKTHRQTGARLLDHYVFPQVGIGEEGDVVARVPIEWVNNVVKVLGRLVEEVVEGFDELQAILGVNSIDQLKFQ